MKQVVINDSKLTISKEKVANLSDSDLDSVQGGKDAEASRTASSTNNDITCCWCTSTITQPTEEA